MLLGPTLLAEPAGAEAGSTLCERILMPVIGNVEGSLAPQSYAIQAEAQRRCQRLVEQARCRNSGR